LGFLVPNDAVRQFIMEENGVFHVNKPYIQSRPVKPRRPMYRTGTANLPLHGGKAPSWLTVRMRKLAREIAYVIIEEQGTTKFIQRLSDPYWFQAFGCVLAFDWHSSGVTTVVTGILKGALSPEEHGIAVWRLCCGDGN